jgi:putative chitinase
MPASTRLSVDVLRPALPLAPIAWLVALCHLPAKWEINSPARQAAFIGQLAHESNQFQRLVERMSYRAERLLVVWPKRFPTPESARPYVQNPQKLANHVYANRLGNGDEASGDGYRFRGSGPLQLTGRANHAAAGKAIGVDLIANPGALLTPRVGLDAAGWFWKSNGLNELADIDDYIGITKRINGGLTGLDDRLDWIFKLKTVLT